LIDITALLRAEIVAEVEGLYPDTVQIQIYGSKRDKRKRQEMIKNDKPR
jgi:hypothetical protein